MNDPLDAPPLLVVTEAGVEVSQGHARTLATAFAHAPGVDLKSTLGIPIGVLSTTEVVPEPLNVNKATARGFAVEGVTGSRAPGSASLQKCSPVGPIYCRSVGSDTSRHSGEAPICVERCSTCAPGCGRC